MEPCGAPLSSGTLCSFGKDYSAVKLGKCAELDALKRADRIFLSRAMDKQCVRQHLILPRSTACKRFSSHLLIGQSSRHCQRCPLTPPRHALLHCACHTVRSTLCEVSNGLAL